MDIYVCIRITKKKNKLTYMQKLTRREEDIPESDESLLPLRLHYRWYPI